MKKQNFKFTIFNTFLVIMFFLNVLHGKSSNYLTQDNTTIGSGDVKTKKKGFNSSIFASSVTYKLSIKGKEVGIKITENAKGQVILTAREIGGKKLFILPILPSKEVKEKNLYTKEFTLKDKSRFSVSLNDDGKLSSTMKDLKIDLMKYVPNEDDATTQGFFGWLGGLASDIVTGVAAAITWLGGNFGEYNLSGGGLLMIHLDGVTYFPGKGGFKLEPGIEEDPRVWY